MEALEATWLEDYQACPLKDSSLPHRMVPTLAPVLRDLEMRKERTLEEQGHSLGLNSSSSSNNSSLT